MSFMAPSGGSAAAPPPPPPPLPPPNPPTLASSSIKTMGVAQRAAAAGAYADTLKTSPQGDRSTTSTAGKQLLSGEK